MWKLFYDFCGGENEEIAFDHRCAGVNFNIPACRSHSLLSKIQEKLKFWFFLIFHVWAENHTREHVIVEKCKKCAHVQWHSTIVNLPSSRDKINKRRLMRSLSSNSNDKNNNDDTRTSASSYSNESSPNESVKKTPISASTTVTTLDATPDYYFSSIYVTDAIFIAWHDRRQQKW